MISTRIAALAASIALLACGGEPIGGTDSGHADAGPDSGPPVEQCTSNAECDNGVHCDGREECRPGEPLTDARGCLAGTLPCAESQTCNELLGRCESDCTANADADGDGYRADNCGGDDCDDGDGEVNPGRAEICDELGRNEDCDPDTLSGPDETDVDGDGYVSVTCCNLQRSGAILCGLDCDDTTAASRPGYPETCDEVDNDCDGMIDERVRTTYYRDADGDLYGDAADTMQMCMQPEGYVASMGDCDDSMSSVHPTAAESCNGVDDDCDSAIDEAVSPAPATETHCGGCDLACPDGYTCTGTTCVDRPVKLAAGATSTCALTEAGNVYCWGGNSEGEVGIGSSATVVDRPMQVTLPMPAVDVGIVSTASNLTTNDYFATACAVLGDGTARCWGSMVGSSPGASPWGAFPAGSVEYSGWLARTASGDVYRIGTSWTLTTLGPATAIAGRCARRVGGDLACLDGASGTATHPAVAGGSVHAGEISFCATRADGRLLCWGRNADCQVGAGSAVISAPQLVPGIPTLALTSVTTHGEYIYLGPGAPAVDVGHSCATIADGRAYCWGGNERGELGTGTASSSDVCSPARVMATERFEDVVAGTRHTCAISDLGEVWCWGANNGLLGTADTTDAHAPTRLFGFPVTVSPSP